MAVVSAVKRVSLQVMTAETEEVDLQLVVAEEVAEEFDLRVDLLEVHTVCLPEV